MSQSNKIFRYKLSDSILGYITEFARIHQYDDRHAYKAAWSEWLNKYADITEREVARLVELNYKGDVLDKMFKAGRYYFRDKVITTNEENEESEEIIKEKTKTTRTYIVMEKDVIQAMDLQLTTIINKPNFKPANGFKMFCEQHLDMLRREITRLTDEEDVDAEMLANKIKKTYKNRYFTLMQHQN
jgi:hypothetical protein